MYLPFSRRTVRSEDIDKLRIAFTVCPVGVLVPAKTVKCTFQVIQSHLHNQKKPFDSALHHPIAKIVPGGFCLVSLSHAARPSKRLHHGGVLFGWLTLVDHPGVLFLRSKCKQLIVLFQVVTTTTCWQIGNETTYDTEKKNMTSHDVADMSAVLGRCVGKTRLNVFKNNFCRHLKQQHFQLSFSVICQ